MTIKSRNRIFALCLILMILVFAEAVIAGAFIFINTAPEAGLLALVDFSNPLCSLLINFVLLLYALISAILLFKHFRKTSSAEVFFFFLFLVFTALESHRIYLLGTPAFSRTDWNIYLSKAAYSLHLLGTLLLLASGFFAAGIPHQRLETALGICILITIFLGPAIPLNTPLQSSNLLLGLGIKQSLLGIFLTLEILGVLNYLYAAWLNGSRHYALMALGLLLVFAGREAVFIQTNLPIMLGGFLSLCLGTWLFSSRAREIYLWF
ncbi:MAG: hypothetical protein LBQ61_07320 [Spirochaetales bacterium]|jgi:hypothetical protein|nr:hypothetical protein [Spirochaetales bacterium]